MEEAKKKEIERKLQQLIEQADHRTKKEKSPPKASPAGVIVIRRRKGKRDAHIF